MSKSISGKYLDEQNFTHVVYYNQSLQKYIKTIYNPKMQHCSHAEYTKEQIINQVSGMTKGFDYLGFTFYPLTKLRGKDGKFENMSKHINDVGLTPENWNYEDFYKASNTRMFDLFLMNGRIVIPASRYLFEYVS